MGILKFLYSVCVIAIVVGCQRKPSIANQHLIICGKRSEKVNNSSWIKSLCLDTSLFKKYQTFDEFDMKGVGIPLKDPYVLVRTMKDTIVVVSSNKSDSCRIYIRRGNGVWHSRMEYELWKGKGYALLKEPWDRAARVYDRYFYNDTIYECCNSFCDTYSDFRFYIKAKDRVTEFWTEGDSRIFRNPTSDVRRLLNEAFSCIPKQSTVLNLLGRKVRFRQYTISEDNQKVYYQYSNKAIGYEFYRKAYGLWGIQPGVDERRLVYGQEIDNFSHEHPNGNSVVGDAVYDSVDEMPSFPGGTQALHNYIRANVGKNESHNTRQTIVLSFVVNEYGSIEDIRIVKSSIENDSINNKAIEMVRNMPKWISGRLNGKCVKVRYMLPITFFVK